MFVKMNGATDVMNRPAPQQAIAEALRRERQRAGLSLTELARRAGLAKSTLSQLESGTGNPSVETLWGLCLALDVPFSRLVEPARPSVAVIRAGSGPTVGSSIASYHATLLASGAASRHDLYFIAAEPGPGRESDPHMPGVVEHVVLTAGSALVGLRDAPVSLEPGDYIRYPGDMPHVFQALTAGTQAVMLSEYQ
jgi:transcriptional regulator with XRE-family HTH domain